MVLLAAIGREPEKIMVAVLVLLSALLAGALMTFAGALAPVYPVADFANHFRPYTLSATGVLFVCALLLRAARAAWASATLAGLNAALVALPLLWSAAPAARRVAGQALASTGGRDLKIVTFNRGAARVAPLARFLLAEDADIVLLQEVDAKEARALKALLLKTYPQSHACVIPRRCGAAIFAKRPWVAAGEEHWTRDAPETVWVQFNDRDFGRLRVYGLHLSLPFAPEAQVHHVDRLIALSLSLAGPTLFAGDFNMTPWSYRLQRLLARADLRRHATFMRSWPTDGQFRLPLPAFLIDHVVTTSDIKTVSIRTGPNLGSDHLPVIAVLRLP
jgi:endonuclease/exonuclease/phosphatase (EEP) superfamily protein YafD